MSAPVSPPLNAASRVARGFTGKIIASYCDPATWRELACADKEFANITSKFIENFKKWRESAGTWEEGQDDVFPCKYNNTIGINVGAGGNSVYCPFIDLLKMSVILPTNFRDEILVSNIQINNDDRSYIINIHPLAFKSMLEFTRSYLTLLNSTRYEVYINAINNVLAEFPKCTALTLSCGQMGGAKKKQYTTYNNKKYQVKIGSRGGKYIVINGQKHYIK